MSYNKAAKALNKYIGDYDTLRPFLRYISYGCHNKQYFQKHYGINARTYEDNLSRIRFFLPENMLLTQRQNRKEIHTIKGDSYYSAHNFLHVTYQIKSCRPEAVFYLLAILQIVENSDTPLSEQEIYNFRLIPDGNKYPDMLPLLEEDLGISLSTLNRYLSTLSALGLIKCNSHHSPKSYGAAPNPLALLTPEEITELRHAIHYYMSIAPMSLPGYQLDTALQIMYCQPPVFKPLCQFKHNRMVRTLDDCVIHEIITAIENEQYLTFRYGSKSVSAIPYHIYIDFLTGRQYLFALARRTSRSHVFSQPQTYRIDMMFNTKRAKLPMNLQDKLPLCLKPALKPLSLRLTCQDSKKMNGLIYRVCSRYPDAQLQHISPQQVICHIQLPDIMRALPWIRTLYPYVEIIDSNSWLNKRIRHDLQEALANYEQI